MDGEGRNHPQSAGRRTTGQTVVVSFSGGVTSWLAGKLAQNGMADGDRMVLLFADTLVEDASTYAFLAAAAADIGEPVTRVADGRTPWQVFEDVRFVGNNRVAPCSRLLKRVPLDKWLRDNCDPATTVSVLGMDWTEVNRFETHRKIKAGDGWTVRAPLIEAGIGKPEAVERAIAAGLPLPALYGEGFPHANCGGACVRAGHAHWERLLTVRPEAFRDAERREAALSLKLGRDSTILRDRSGGSTAPLSLRAFRERIEAQGLHRKWRSIGARAPVESTMSDSRRGSAGLRTTRRYRTWRTWMMTKRPLCAHCLAEGRTVAAVELDHVVPLAQGGGLMDALNVQGLCDAHHRKKTAADFGHGTPASDGWSERLEAMR